MPRMEFSEKTKLTVASRSGFHCSIPECRRSTIGPGADPSAVVNSGVAAHIHSASPGGPRGQGRLTESELADAENAIWLCSDHARIVDTQDGAGYSPATLISFKHLNEARAAHEQGSLHVPFRWLQQLTLRATPITLPDQQLQLGRVNLLVGDNATGKTALCEWLSAFADLERLGRWRISWGRGDHVDMELKYFDPAPHVARLSTGMDRAVTFTLDGRPVPLIALPIRVVFPSRVLERLRRGTEDDLHSLSGALALDPAICLNLTNEIDCGSDSSLRNVNRAGIPGGSIP